VADLGSRALSVISWLDAMVFWVGITDSQAIVLARQTVAGTRKMNSVAGYVHCL
jgi:hypothetical protein